MECRFCKSWNDEDDRRCQRCGRRLHAASPRPAPDAYPSMNAPVASAPPPVMSAAVPALEALPGGRLADFARTQPSPEVRYQQSLFNDAATGPKVVPIPTLTPMHPSAGGKRAANRSRTPRRGHGTQQALDFNGGLEAQSLDMQVEAVIYCDAPVAMPLHRFIAAAFDASMVLIALGLFFGVFLFSGGHIAFAKQMIPLFVLMAGLVWGLYHSFWCLANGDTPGMRFAGLRVMNFDGLAADRNQRGLRQAAFVLSVLSAGVGLFWAFVDEENLTWHDHISKTFPTPG